jgi:hypothetical protein
MLGTGLVTPTGEAYSEYDHEPDDQGRERTPREQALRAVHLIRDALSDEENQVRLYAASFFIDYARQLVALGFHEEFLAAVDKALELSGRVGALAEELDMILAYESPPEDVRSRIVHMRNALARDLRTRVRLVVEGWSIVDPETDTRDVLRPDPTSVAAEVVDANEQSLPELVGLIFEDSAKNPGELLASVAKLQRATRVWSHVLESGRARHKAWPTAIFLSTARQAGIALVPGALELLTSSDGFAREVGANALTMGVCTEEEVRVLSDELRAGRVDPNWTRPCYMGRWNEKQTPGAVATLVAGLVAQRAGAGIAVSLCHRALESNQGIDNALIIEALAASAPFVQGHELWVWERVGFLIAKQAPGPLFEALFEKIAVDGVGRADDEIEQVLAACCREVPSLAPRLLQLWDTQPYFVARQLGSIITSQVGADDLIAWAGDDRSRQSALGRMVIPCDAELTVELVEALGDEGPLASAIEGAAGSGTWSGEMSGFYSSRGEQWKRYADAATTPRFRRLAERISRRLLASAEEARKAEADEDATER